MVGCWIFFFFFFFLWNCSLFFLKYGAISWSPEEFRRSSISLNLIEWNESCWMFYFGVELWPLFFGKMKVLYYFEVTIFLVSKTTIHLVNDYFLSLLTILFYQ